MCPDDLSSGAASMINPEHLVGTWHRFGAIGPVYEVIGTGQALSDGDRLMRVRLLESEEEADYKLSEIVGDPREG